MPLDVRSLFESQKFLALQTVLKHLPALVRLYPHDSEDKRFIHKLYREIIPIAVVAQLVQAKRIRFTNDKTDPDNTFDGILMLSDGTRKIVECTSAVKGQQKRGKFSSFFQEIPFMKFFSSPHFVRHPLDDTPLSEVPKYPDFRRRIMRAVTRKIKKNNISYQGAWLLVTTNYPWLAFSEMDKVLPEGFLKHQFRTFSRLFVLTPEGGPRLTVAMDYIPSNPAPKP